MNTLVTNVVLILFVACVLTGAFSPLWKKKITINLSDEDICKLFVPGTQYSVEAFQGELRKVTATDHPFSEVADRLNHLVQMGLVRIEKVKVPPVICTSKDPDSYTQIFSLYYK